MVRRPSRVHELIPLIDGLFAHMDYTFWDFTADELEILMESRFGQRPVAPLLDIIQGPPQDPCEPRSPLNDAQLTLLANIILKTFRNKWDRLGAIHSLEYDVLKNYLDEYQEVLRDETDASTEREVQRADENSELSRLTTTSDTEGEQSNVSSNESTNVRNDSFSSEFSRVSKDSQLRTDSLEESKVRSEATDATRTDNLSESSERSSEGSETRTDNLQETLEKSVSGTQTRTDNLQDATTGTGTENVTHSGGNYKESTDRVLASSGTENNASGLYGFNSSDPVGDSTSDTDASKDEHETIEKTHTGSKTDNLSKSENTTVNHTGTQGTISETDESYVKGNTGTQGKVNDVQESITKSNTGTQKTLTDVDEAYIKANRGTQGIEEDTSISDSTHTTDDQESSSLSHGASSGKNLSSATTESNTESNKQNVSRLTDSSIVNSALARAKQSIHKGNIGNLTPQQLITQEIELWRWNFIDEVMSDIKSMITIPVYI